MVELWKFSTNVSELSANERVDGRHASIDGESMEVDRVRVEIEGRSERADDESQGDYDVSVGADGWMAGLGCGCDGVDGDSVGVADGSLGVDFEEWELKCRINREKFVSWWRMYET